MYRPEFVYPLSPPNSKDGRCLYSFDGSNTPALAGMILPGNAYSTAILLTLDQDADFFLRGILIQETALLIGLLDPMNNQLVNPLIPGNPPTLLPDLWSATDGIGIEALESDDWGIFCPAGSSLTVYVQNATAAPIAGPAIRLDGIKRYCGDQCK
jgi:hypothetical protein